MTTSIEIIDIAGDETPDEAAARRIRQSIAGMKFRPSQTQIATAVGMIQQKLNRRLSGAVPFTLTEYTAICEYLELDLVYILTGRKSPRPDGPDGDGGNVSRLRESNSRPFHYE